ncbi:MAG: DEAD/DEAH box helicase [Comamonadaceae bacterium]|nr:DEAD/DEAH box helicase [Comamonadaceae bacterium]
MLSRMLAEGWPGTERSLRLPDQGAAEQPGGQALALRRAWSDARVEVWHGDIGAVAQEARADDGRPDILLTTPESIEAMLISARIDRAAVVRQRCARSIVDELHAFAGDDRGWHLRSRAAPAGRATAERPLQRIGLSATVEQPERAARLVRARAVNGRSWVSVQRQHRCRRRPSTMSARSRTQPPSISRLHRGEQAPGVLRLAQHARSSWAAMLRELERADLRQPRLAQRRTSDARPKRRSPRNATA